jgi:hypothetical protein
MKEDTMETPVMYYINIGFTWFLVLMSIWGYTAILRNTGQKMLFWLFFGLGWALLGFSHIFTLGGTPAEIWYMMVLRIAGYAILVISVLSLMIHIVNRDSI